MIEAKHVEQAFNRYRDFRELQPGEFLERSQEPDGRQNERPKRVGLPNPLASVARPRLRSGVASKIEREPGWLATFTTGAYVGLVIGLMANQLAE